MLTSAQIKQTSIELNKNLEISKLSNETICKDLNISQYELTSVLTMNDVNPTTVWRVRDYLVKSIEEQGKQAMPFSALKVNIWYPYD